MKRILLPLLLGGALSMGMIAAALPVHSEAEEMFDESNIVLTFSNMSDTHVGFGNDAEMLLNALKTVKKFAKNKIDALQFCGDQTQNGKEAEAKQFVSLLEEEFDLTKTAAVITHGNHDTYWTGCMTPAQFAEAFGGKVYTFDSDDTDYTTGNRHVVVNGYHFLSVQIRAYSGKNLNNPVSDKAWLKRTLDAIVEENPERYVFVSCHCPVPDTVYGSEADWGIGDWGASSDLESVLKDYPQVVLFSGHTHFAVNDERSISQTGFTAVQSGSVSDIDAERGYAEFPGSWVGGGGMADRRQYSQGMLVEADGAGRVRITRIDFRLGKQIKQSWYLDPVSADGSHLNRYSAATRAKTNRRPAFGEGAALKVRELSRESVEITYPAATDDDMVYGYDIRLLDKDGKEAASLRTMSPWYDYPDAVIPSPRTAQLKWSVGYPYTVEVTAHDSFGLASEPLRITMRDTTEEERAAAALLDERIGALAQKTLSEGDGEEIRKIRAAIGELGFKGLSFLKGGETFAFVERSYYNTFALSADAAVYAPRMSDTFNTIPTASRGGVKDSEFTGVSLSWTGASMNSNIGFDREYALDGLHIAISGLTIGSDNRIFGILLSNRPKDKCLNGETFLLTIDFETGSVAAGGTKLGETELLRYARLGATPFSLRFLKQGEEFCLSVSTLSGDAKFPIPQSAFDVPNYTDFGRTYVSFSPWAQRTVGSFDVVAIHGGQEPCSVYPEDKPDDKPDDQPDDKPDDQPDDKPDVNPDPNPGDKPDDKPDESKPDGEDEKKGCGGMIGMAGCGAVLLLFAAACVIKKR